MNKKLLVCICQNERNPRVTVILDVFLLILIKKKKISYMSRALQYL